MLAVDGAVGSCDGGLDVAQRGVDPFERRRACRLRSRPGRGDLMRAPGIGDAGETRRPPLTTAQSGSRLRLANPAIEAAQKLVTRRNFSRRAREACSPGLQSSINGSPLRRGRRKEFRQKPVIIGDVIPAMRDWLACGYFRQMPRFQRESQEF